jgi:hypothetical protein
MNLLNLITFVTVFNTNRSFFGLFIGLIKISLHKYYKEFKNKINYIKISQFIVKMIKVIFKCAKKVFSNRVYLN